MKKNSILKEFAEKKQFKVPQGKDEAKEGKKSKIRYYVDKEARTVVAVMEKSESDIEDVFQKIGIEFSSCLKPSANRVSMKKIYRGKAKCAQEDAWDEELGKTLARNRLLEKYYRDYSLCLMEMERFFYQVYRDIGERVDSADKRYTRAVRNSL